MKFKVDETESKLSCMNLKALATTLPGKEHLAIIELGDAIFPHDQEVHIIKAPFPHVVLVYSKLDPWFIYGLIIANPPASIYRFVPIEKCIQTDLKKVVKAAVDLLERKLKNKKAFVHISCTCRGVNLSPSNIEREIALTIKNRELAIPVLRLKDAEYEVKVEILANITGIALIPKGINNIKKIVKKLSKVF